MRYLCWALIYTGRKNVYRYTGKIFLVIQQNIKRQIEKWGGFFNSVQIGV
jgi:hypothetical protein